MTNQSLENHIYEYMDSKSNRELIDIWVNNNHDEWSEDAFSVIKAILLSRKIEIPVQKCWKQAHSGVEKPYRFKYLNLLPVYWIGFAIYILFLMTVKYFHLPISNSRLFFLIFLPVIGLNVFEAERIKRYIKKNYIGIWHNLNDFLFLGIRGRDDFNFLRFLLEATTSDDKNIEGVKTSYTNVVLISLLLTIAFVILFSSAN